MAALIAIEKCVPVWENVTEIMCMVDSKTSPSIMCSATDNPMRVFTWSELIYELVRPFKIKIQEISGAQHRLK